MLGIIIVAIVALVLGVIYLAKFKAEGLAAAYFLGMPLIYTIAERMSIPWSTPLTGLYFLLVFLVCVVWWWLSPRDESVEMRRSLTLSASIILGLTILWQICHAIDRQLYIPETPYENLKWAFAIAKWAAPFILGVMFPLSLTRLRRFLAAGGTLGVTTAAIMLFFFLTGRGHAAHWGYRFSPAERLSVVATGSALAMGLGALWAHTYLVHHIRPNKRRLVFIGICTAFVMLTIFLSGTRGPILSLLVTASLILLLVGGRNAIRLAFVMLFVVAIFIALLPIIPQTTMTRFTAEKIGGASGISLRLYYIGRTFDMLDYSPVLGRTIGQESIVGVEYPHNLTLQFMTDLGLVGLTLFLVAIISTLIRFLVAARSHGTISQLFAFPILILFIEMFIERHSGGSMLQADVWLAMGMMMGHRLIPRDEGSPYTIAELHELENGGWILQNDWEVAYAAT